MNQKAVGVNQLFAYALEVRHNLSLQPDVPRWGFDRRLRRHGVSRLRELPAAASGGYAAQRQEREALSMRLRLEHFYFGLAIVGLVATWYFNLQYFAGGGSVAPGPFLGSAFANPLTTAITVDVYWAALVFSVWALAERRQATAPVAWPYIVLCFAIGLAFAFPLYLGHRQHLARRVTAGQASLQRQTAE